MKYLLDASTVLAVLLREPGAARVTEALEQSGLSAANLSEVVARLSDLTLPMEAIRDSIASLNVPVLAVEEKDGFAAGLLRQATRSAGLSLGDRICLATAERKGLTVLTADRPFLRVAQAITVEIELIR